MPYPSSRLKDHALNAKPITSNPMSLATYLIFTDASMEDEGASVGGVSYDHLGNPLSFSQKLDDSHDSLVSSLRETSDHPIYEIELLGTWMGMKISD